MNSLGTAVESQLFTTLEKAGVPGHLHGGLVRYLVYRLAPGHFLTAVLANDLREAISRADTDSEAGLGHLVRFLYNDAPALAWGSPAKVEAWLEDKP